MNWKRGTVIFIVTVFIAIVLWDALAIIEAGKEASISHTFIEWSYKYPIITFLMGFIMGHLFWRMGDTKVTAQLTEKKEGEV